MYRAAVLLRRTGRAPRWRYFSLTQVNSERDGRPPGWTVWGAPEDDEAPGRAAFRAAEAARRQDRFEQMHAALLSARHERQRDLEDARVLREVAAEAGLDLERFEQDLRDPALLDRLRADHEEAVSVHGVFGTPTFVAPGGGAAYVRLQEVPETAEAADAAVALLEDVLAGRPYLLELKRPVPPRKK